MRRITRQKERIFFQPFFLLSFFSLGKDEKREAGYNWLNALILVRLIVVASYIGSKLVLGFWTSALGGVSVQWVSLFWPLAKHRFRFRIEQIDLLSMMSFSCSY